MKTDAEDSALSQLPLMPSFVGYVDTTLDAMYLGYAAQQCYISRLLRRLNRQERELTIKSGAVFIFGVEETGIQRWTGNHSDICYIVRIVRADSDGATQMGTSGPLLASMAIFWYPAYNEVRGRSLNRRDRGNGFVYRGSIPKPDGLLKKTITLVVNGTELHMVAYYTQKDVESGRLKTPSSRLNFKNIYLPPDVFDQSKFRYKLETKVGSDGKRYFKKERAREARNRKGSMSQQHRENNTNSTTSTNELRLLPSPTSLLRFGTRPQDAASHPPNQLVDHVSQHSLSKLQLNFSNPYPQPRLQAPRPMVSHSVQYSHGNTGYAYSADLEVGQSFANHTSWVSSGYESHVAGANSVARPLTTWVDRGYYM
ncbi:hypothetical protein VKT23_006109 [Stygiomarasmius scandens]|uniref:Uncharacterized protein n=1 Tax=Marasmiellus scandens TaxID=2682957 RepID=A0ABR1JRC1_9AGAR